MPTLDLSDEEAQQLTLILANASGPGISWMMTNNLLTKLQSATQKPAGPDWRPSAPNPNGLDPDPPLAPQPGQSRAPRRT